MTAPAVAPPKNLGRAVAKGAAWILAVRLVRRSIGVVSTLILARLLTPADFGVYALAMSVYVLVELMRAFGFGLALIQKQDATDGHYDTGWTLGILFSVVCTVVLVTVAPIAAHILDEPKLEPVLRFVSLLFLIEAAINIGTINFQKHMTFDKYFNMQVAAKVAAFLVTVPMAFILKSYWAMLYGLLAAACARVVLSYMMSPYRPRLRLPYWREMLSFSTWLQVNNIIDYANRHAANFMVSRASGVAGVGMLSMSRDLGKIIMDVAQPINQAAYPAYARVNHDVLQVRDIFSKVVGNLLVMGIAMGVGVSSTAHLIVPTMLGSQWLSIVPLIHWFALVSIFELLVFSANRVMIAVGRPRWATFIISVRLVLYLSSMSLLLPMFGVVGVAYAALWTLILVLLYSLYLLKRVICFELKRFLYMLYKPMVAALVMRIAISLLFPEHWAEEHVTMQVIQMLAAVCLGAFCFTGVLLMLWMLESRPEGPESHFLTILWEKTGLFGFLLGKSKKKQ